MKAKRIVTFAIGVVALFGMFFGKALAASPATDTFQVQATVNAICVVSAADLTFSTPYDGGAGADNDSGQANISVNCTKNAPYTVALNIGTVAGTSFAPRLMSNGTDTMQYNLYTTAGRTVVWGDGTGATATVGGTGQGLGGPQVQTHTVFGRIFQGQATLSVGTYTEPTITVTVSY